MKNQEINRNKLDKLSYEIIGCVIEVHKTLGVGLLESTYSSCLAYEFVEKGIYFEKEKELPIEYKGKIIDCGYRIDFLVENEIILELKSVNNLLPIHHAQILTYLRLADKRLGLLINFNEMIVKNGIIRVVNNF